MVVTYECVSSVQFCQQVAKGVILIIHPCCAENDFGCDCQGCYCNALTTTTAATTPTTTTAKKAGLRAMAIMGGVSKHVQVYQNCACHNEFVLEYLQASHTTVHSRSRFSFTLT